MPQQRWTAVDEYLCRTLVPTDEALQQALRDNAANGLPPHDVAPNQGRMLWLLAKLANARVILEIGTLGGFSTIWLARALPANGRLVTLEANPKHAAVARANLARAGVADRVEVREGRAVDSLAELDSSGAGPFDVIFIDADKPGNPDYLRWALRLARVGTLIIADNVVRGGAVIDVTSDDANVHGIRRFLDLVGDEPRLAATAIQTVGSKGYDGFALALVIA